MKIFFTLLSFIVSILLLGNSTYTTTVAEQNDIEKQEVVFSSEKRITSDYLEGSGGVNFWCETIDGEIYLKLECENGRVQSNIISKYNTVNYYLNAGNQMDDEYADRITIHYYDADGKLLCWSTKFIYWDSIQETYDSSDIGV